MAQRKCSCAILPTFVAVFTIETPVNQAVDWEGRRLWIKRLDLIHPAVNGNKFYKLRYNIEAAKTGEYSKVLTFGGAWSNHLYATAAACKMMGIPSVGVIRGEQQQETATLRFARDHGMELCFITREAYAEKDTEEMTAWLHEQYGDFYRIPEGGSNFLGVNGCMEILSAGDKEQFRVIAVAGGTGATAAGLLLSAGPGQRVFMASALRGKGQEEMVIDHIRHFLSDATAAEEYRAALTVVEEDQFGGYGKWNAALEALIAERRASWGISFDQVYTAKLLWQLTRYYRSGGIGQDEEVLLIHTGGLQGLEGIRSTVS